MIPYLPGILNKKTETTELPHPSLPTKEEGEAEIILLNEELKALSLQVAPIREQVLRIYKKMASLNKKRHSIQTYLTVGITKVPPRKTGYLLPKISSEVEYFAYLQSLPLEQLKHLQNSS